MHHMDGSEKSDMSLLKRELSLDLEGSKMSVDGDASQSSSNNKQIINIPSTPNTPNFTHTSGNTSQSMTPSEFGYQHLTRQSAAVSLENSPKSDRNVYEHLEQSFSSYEGTTRLNITTPVSAAAAAANSAINAVANKLKATSPIRSTINITYNVKSPVKIPDTHENVFFASNLENNKKQTNVMSDYEEINIVSVPITVAKLQHDQSKKLLLETSFDENMVYEQVKFYKGAVSEVNSLLVDNGNNDIKSDDKSYCMDAEEHTPVASPRSPKDHQIVPDMDTPIIELKSSLDHYLLDTTKEINSNVVCDSDLSNNLESKGKFIDTNDDVPMYDHELDDIQDSLELDSNISLYENVELRRPLSVYENVDIQQNVSKTQTQERTTNTSDLPATKLNERKESKPKANFMVKKLATKFETSPIDTQPPFDFSKPFVKKLDNNRNSPCIIKAKNNKQLHKSAKITRSLDENAFVREFGNTPKLENINKSSQQISEVDGRRMSLEFTRPKSLNPPKRLPDLSDDAEREICKSDNSKLKLDFSKIDVQQQPKYDIKITPTTENPISLIQHNVYAGGDSTNKQQMLEDEKSLSSLSSIKGLGNCKLDRDRIEKIKEERRHQLNEKFRSESFRAINTVAAGVAAGGTNIENEYIKAKSKSKIELRDIRDSGMEKSDTLRFKSKSKGDVRSISSRDVQDDLSHVTTTLGLISGGSSRVRRISDEKNQNDCTIDYLGTTDSKLCENTMNIMAVVTTPPITSATSAHSVTTKARKFDKKDIDFIGSRDRDNFTTVTSAATATTRSSLNSQ